MKAFVKVIHFSDGRSPAEAEASMKGLGFERVKGSSVFEAEVLDEVAGAALIERMHAALRGTNLIYEPSLGRAPDPGMAAAGTYRERLAKWKDIGLDADELADLLKYDPDRFRARGLEMFRVQLDRAVAEREREIRETEARERLERARERIANAVKEPGGQTFQQLVALSGVDEEVLTHMLDEMVKKGQLAARQSGRRVAYLAV